MSHQPESTRIVEVTGAAGSRLEALQNYAIYERGLALHRIDDPACGRDTSCPLLRVRNQWYARYTGKPHVSVRSA